MVVRTLFKTEPYPIVFTGGFFRVIKRLIEPGEFLRRFGENNNTCNSEMWSELQDERIHPEWIQLIKSIYLGPRSVASKNTNPRSSEFRERIKDTLHSLVAESFTCLSDDPNVRYFSLDSWWGSGSSGHKADLKNYILHPTLQIYVPNRLSISKKKS